MGPQSSGILVFYVARGEIWLSGGCVGGSHLATPFPPKKVAIRISNALSHLNLIVTSPPDLFLSHLLFCFLLFYFIYFYFWFYSLRIKAYYGQIIINALSFFFTNFQNKLNRKWWHQDISSCFFFFNLFTVALKN